MKDAQARGIIRLGDKTSHGGEVISAASDFTVLGKAVAVEGDLKPARRFATPNSRLTPPDPRLVTARP